MYGNKVIDLHQRHAHHRASIAIPARSIWEVDAKAPTDPRPVRRRRARRALRRRRSTIRTAGGKELMLQGESTGGQLGTRSWVGALDVDNGKLAWRTFTIPAPGEPGSETLEGQPQRLAHRRRRRVADRVLRPGHQPAVLRHRRRVPELRSAVPARAITCSPRAPSRSMPTPARSCGTSRRPRTSIGTSTRRAQDAL